MKTVLAMELGLVISGPSHHILHTQLASEPMIEVIYNILLVSVELTYFLCSPKSGIVTLTKLLGN